MFARNMPLAEHLSRLRCADLFLDTRPYNAHTTASDALWAGVPLLTCPGQSFASRVAASLLTALDLPELIAPTMDDYEHLAIELARNPEKLSALKAKLAHNKQHAPLFDGKIFARHLEAAYEAMFARHLAGLPPAVIDIPPLPPR